MSALLWVALGSTLGGSTRYLLKHIFQDLERDFPFVILIINLLGCFLIGFITVFLSYSSSGKAFYNHFLIIGFCGSFTTFSTFCKENLSLIERGQYGFVLLHLFLSVGIGIFLFF